MRSKALVLGGVIAAAAAAGGSIWFVKYRGTPARLMGWKPEAPDKAANGAPPAAPLAPAPPVLTPHALAGQAAPAKGSAAQSESLLGFSRYLPPAIEDYQALLDAKRVWEAISGSKAFRRLADTPEAKTFVEALSRELAGGLPPDARQALDLLAQAFSTEIVLALPEGSLRSTLGLAEAVLFTAVRLAPLPHSPRPDLLAKKLEPFHAVWKSSLGTFRVPTLVLAARLRDEKPFNEFISRMVDDGWKGFLEAIASAPSLESGTRKALTEAFQSVKIGEMPFWRLRLRGAQLFPESFAKSLEALPMGEEDRALVFATLRALSIDMHLGFVGEYLTLTISPDDRFIGEIVERFQGKAKETFASSARFEGIRARLTSAALTVSYRDLKDLYQAARELLPLLDAAADPELPGLLGLPFPMSGAPSLEIFRILRRDMERELSNSHPRTDELIALERGLRRSCVLRGGPASQQKGPLKTPKLVPADAIAYQAISDGSLESLWDMIRDGIRSFVAMATGGAAGPGAPPELVQMAKAVEASLLGPLDGKIVPGFKGEMGLILASAAPITIATDRPRTFPIPGLAFVVHSAEPDKAIEGVGEFLRAVVRMGQPPSRQPGGPPPIDLVERQMDGEKVHALEVAGLEVPGLEPHFARVGEALVFSSSWSVTRRIRKAALAGSSGPDSTAHGKLKGLLDPNALELSFIDFGRLFGALQALAASVIDTIEKDSGPGGRNAPPGASPFEQARRIAGEISATLTPIRGQASRRAADGEGQVEDSWLLISEAEE